ncbi:hypothetical protein [Allorhodopirellula solitaria]|nr:hypothetical protein [Allorhodopirellula solitaria]
MSSTPYGSEGGGYGEGSGYGSESGPAASGPEANLTTGPTPMSLYQLVQPEWTPLRQQLARVMQPPTTPPTPPMVGPLLRNEANVAYRYGNLPLARELYFGFLARGGVDSQEDLNSLKFSAYFRRPVWQLRWGASIGLHGDTEVTDYAPIRADGKTPGGMGEMAGMGEMSSSYESEMMGPNSGLGPEGGPGSSSMDSMSPYEQRMDAVGGPGSSGTPQYDRDGRMIDPSASVAAAPEAQMTDPSVGERMEELMGYVATVVTEGMKTRMASGQFGAAFANLDPDAKDQGDTVAGDYVQPSDPRMWIPSVVYLGEGSTQEMSKAAAEQNIELLLHFDVSMKTVRNSSPQNSTRVKVIDGRSGRTLITSDEMDNRELQRLLQTKRATAESYVNDALEKFWSVLDSKLSLRDFPTLTPAQSRARVTGVLGDSTFSLLRKLAEIRYMGNQGWLTEDEMEQAFAIAASNDGMTILYGSQADAVTAIHEIAQ